MAVVRPRTAAFLITKARRHATVFVPQSIVFWEELTFHPGTKILNGKDGVDGISIPLL